MTLIASFPTRTARDALKGDLARLGERIAANPQAILPAEFRAAVPVPRGLDQPAKVAWLRAWAASWHVPVVADEDGTLTAEVREGAASFYAVVTPAGSGHVVRRLDDLRDRASFEQALDGAA